MMDNGFSSPRNDAFPAGLRVLVVDDDPTWLKILEKMLKKCSYEVTTCGLARDALNLLRERKGGFDIVLSDVNMPDMDGFILLELVGLEMDLPVIMMSVDGETRRVMKGVQHGACDYLLKPIRMKELRNIWQHVLRKKIHEVRDIDNYESIEDIQMFRNGSDQIDEGHLLSRDDSTPILVRKRKDVEDNHGDKEFGDPSSTKKARVFWTIDLHQKFVRAVNQIGIDKIGPKKILDLMNVPWLTRENVASHLQKYRLYLSRLPKENDLMFSSNGAMHSDLSPKDPTGNFGFQNSLNVVQSDASSSNYGFSGNKIRIQNADPTIHECDLKGVFQSSRTEPKKPLTVDVPIYQKDGRRRMGQNHSCESPVADENYATFNFTIPTQNFWSGEVSEIQLKQEHKTHFQLKDGFNHLPEFGLQQNILHDRLKPSPSINVYPSITERDKMGPVEINPLYANYRSNHIKDLALAGSANNWFSKVPISTATLSTKTHGFNQNCVNDTESSRRNVISDSGSAVAYLGKDLQLHWLQGDYCNTNIELQKIDFLDYNEPDLITDVPLFLYDALRFDYDYPCDSVEYPIFDQRPLHEPFSFAASGNQTSSVKLGI